MKQKISKNLAIVRPDFRRACAVAVISLVSLQSATALPDHLPANKLKVISEKFDKNVSGVVKNASGSVIPGVNVVVKGISTGTSTDADGKYSITVTDDNAVLVFSSIGFRKSQSEVALKRTKGPGDPLVRFAVKRMLSFVVLSHELAS